MNKQQLLQNVANNAKFDDLTIYETERETLIGFKLNRKNSYKYVWFRVIKGDEDENVFFNKTYSQNTGKSSYSYKSVRETLWAIGYFNSNN
jgi:hypothetical protein